MKKTFMALFFVAGFLFATLSFAQIYNGRQPEITGPMDRAAAQSNALWANVAGAGDAEWSGTAAQRYTNMTTPNNEANQRHFNAAQNYHTVNELPHGQLSDEVK